MNQDVALATLHAFCRSYEMASFSRAAKNLGVSPTAVSRSVARVEALLGAQLFRRTTRRFEATPEGHTYYQACRQALALLEDASREVRDDGAVRGRVRISAPTTYGNHVLPSRLSSFQQMHPEVHVELHVGNQNVDFVREGFDLAIRMGTIREAGLVARPLGRFGLVTVASRAYLDANGIPKSVSDLASHQTIAFMMPRTGRALPWLFDAPEERHVPRGTLSVREDPAAGVALARAGLGVFQMYEFMVRDLVRRGELVEVLKSRRGGDRPFSLVYPAAARRSTATRRLIEHLTAR
jgi:DNA-binding transcriptional LysR family regulator